MNRDIGRSIAGCVGILVLAAGCAGLFSVRPAFARETEATVSSQQRRVRDVRERAARLRQQDPEKFRQAVQQRRQALHQRLQYLKETDPEKYRQAVAKIRQIKLARLQHLKKEDPDKFNEIVDQRRGHVEERLARLKQTDPEKYEKAMAFKKKLERLHEMRRDDPEAFGRFLQDHPRLKERLGRDCRGKASSGRLPQEDTAEDDVPY
ncbi:MAG: hypothetical protein PHH75_04185 [Candidatus Omnitrophica bacterium]|nr:hypothetical protein [Candidatus Omnitrophota bacterium]MDD5574357.1 hypothetical protein [Candidatus Omnitrophota bacterium]